MEWKLLADCFCFIRILRTNQLFCGIVYIFVSHFLILWFLFLDCFGKGKINKITTKIISYLIILFSLFLSFSLFSCHKIIAWTQNQSKTINFSMDISGYMIWSNCQTDCAHRVHTWKKRQDLFILNNTTSFTEWSHSFDHSVYMWWIYFDKMCKNVYDV